MGKRYTSLKDKKYGKYLYKIYASMKGRVYRETSQCYKNYGGRGITVCDEWLDKEQGFERFYAWAINNGFYYDKSGVKYNKCTLDRIDNNKGYSPDNCRFVDRYCQNNNKRDNLIFEINGKSMSLRAWCREYNMPYLSVYLRIKRRNWDFMRALTEPMNKKRGGKRR